MISLISPAKSLDFQCPLSTESFTQPDFQTQTQALINELKKLTEADIAGMMSLSKTLAELNHQRFKNFSFPFHPDNARQAILAFRGDVYQGLDVDTFNQQDFQFAQSHLRILSGLYGLLKPLDLIQPYRLEMGTRFANSKGKNLYEFWGLDIHNTLKQDLEKHKAPILINLASNEYFKAVKAKQLGCKIITPVFKEYKNGQYKIISFFAKRARGMMARFIIKNRIDEITSLQSFTCDGYRFDTKSRDANEWVFLRKE